MRPNWRHNDRPVLITEARLSGDDQFDRRRRRYLLMMTLRGVCVIAAAATVGISGWLAAGFVVGALVLPWTAVLLANDRPPKQGTEFRRFVPGFTAAQAPELTAGNASDRSAPEPEHHPVIDL